MAIYTMLTSTTIKPSDVEFFLSDSDTRYEDLCKSLEGFVSYNKTQPDANTRVQEIVWATNAAWVNYKDVANTNQLIIDNKAYNQANGITYSVVVTDIPSP